MEGQKSPRLVWSGRPRAVALGLDPGARALGLPWGAGTHFPTVPGPVSSGEGAEWCLLMPLAGGCSEVCSHVDPGVPTP